MSAPQPSGRSPRGLQARPPAEERRGWLTHGLAALAISGLGLAVAGTGALTTSAETLHSDVRVTRTAPQDTAAEVPAEDLPLPVPGTGPRPSRGEPEESSKQEGLAAFAPRQGPADSPEEAVQRAVVKERAAQRAEELSKAAEDATRLTRTASSQVRAKDLASQDRAARENAVKIATERRQRALAARIAAEVDRKKAEAAARAAASNSTAAGTPSTSEGSTTTTAPAPPADVPSTGGRGVSPVPGAVVGSSFGATGLWARYHTGLDFRASQGTPIRAVQSGVVLYAGNAGNWSGNHVAVQHAGGLTTMSSHMSSISVTVGERVSAGQVIGRVGQTGRAFGAHLHFELYPRGVKYGDVYSAVNPVPWLRSVGVTTR